jgi:hypothetical protein
MISIKVEGLEALRKNLALAERKVEIATQRAMLKTAYAIREAEKAEMQRVFDRPTRWTMGAMKVKPTAKMEIQVGLDESDYWWYRANNYLGTQMHGGQRRHKAMEKALQRYRIMPQGWYVVPGQRAKLDAYGNHSVGEIRQILSWFDAAEMAAGSYQNMYFAGREKRRKGTRKKAGFEYFAIQPGGQRSFMRGSGKTGRHKMQPGIYRRTFYGMGNRIEPIMIFVKSANYKPRFNFEGVARKTFDRQWPVEIQAAIRRELEKAAGAA